MRIPASRQTRQNSIQNERQIRLFLPQTPDDIGNRLGIGPIADNTDLDGRDRYLLNQNVRLPCNDIGIHGVDGIDLVIILNSQGCNNGKRMCTCCTDGLDIGSNPGPTTWIEPGKNKHTRT